MFMLRRSRSTTALTLVEVLAVLVILGLLAATLTIGIGGKMGQAKTEIARTQIGQLVAQVETFRLTHKRLPNSSEGLAALSDDPSSGYYVEAGKLIDPWGQPFLYLVPGPGGHPFEILTYGADGQSGGDGEAVDVSSSALAAGS
jgi:general secretion pathway protein G